MKLKRARWWEIKHSIYFQYYKWFIWHTSSRSFNGPIQAIPKYGNDAVNPIKAVHPSSVLIVLLLSFFPVELAPLFAPFCTWRFNSRAMCGGIFVIFISFLVWYDSLGSADLTPSKGKTYVCNEHDACCYDFDRNKEIKSGTRIFFMKQTEKRSKESKNRNHRHPNDLNVWDTDIKYVHTIDSEQ